MKLDSWNLVGFTGRFFENLLLPDPICTHNWARILKLSGKYPPWPIGTFRVSMTLTYFSRPLELEYLNMMKSYHHRAVGTFHKSMEWPWPTFRGHWTDFRKYGLAAILKLCGKILTIGPSEPCTYQWPWPIFKCTRVMALTCCLLSNAYLCVMKLYP